MLPSSCCTPTGEDDRVCAALRASDNLTVLAVEVPVEAPITDGLPLLGVNSSRWAGRRRVQSGGAGRKARMLRYSHYEPRSPGSQQAISDECAALRIAARYAAGISRPGATGDQMTQAMIDDELLARCRHRYPNVSLESAWVRAGVLLTHQASLKGAGSKRHSAERYTSPSSSRRARRVSASPTHSSRRIGSATPAPFSTLCPDTLPEGDDEM